MGEVDEPQHAVDHGVAERDQRVDAADGEPEHQEVEPLGERVAALDQGSDRAADHHRHDADAQAPKDDVDEGEAREAAEAGDERAGRRDVAIDEP